MIERKSAEHPASPARARWTIALLILVVIGAFAGLAAADRVERYAAADRERAVIVQIAGRLAENILDRHGRLLARLADEAGAGGPDEAVRNLLAAVPALDPDVRTIAMLDAGGTIVARSPAAVTGTAFDKIAAEAMAGARDTGVYATTAVPDPELGIDLIGLARMRRGSDGAFGGVVVVAIDAASLMPRDRLPPLPPGSRLTILRRDGAILYAAGGVQASAEPAAVAREPGLSPLTIGYQRAPGEIADAWRAVWLRNGAVVGTVGLVVAFAAFWLERRRRRIARHAAARQAREARALQANVAELAAAKTRADEESRAKSLFLAQVSHELRTPLNAILGFSEAIKRQIFGPIANPRYVDYGGLIHDAGSHLLSLINDLLDLSKLEEGRMEIAPIRVSAAALARSTFDLVELLARERNLTLVLSGVEGCCDLHVDPRAAKQVLVNLLSNAIKFTPPGGRIDVRFASRGDGAVVVTVADTGVGMSPDEIRLAFEPFARVRGEATERTPGTGLGLPIARALMRLHGGDLTLTSRPGAGTSAIAVFPAEAAISTPGTLSVLLSAAAA
jgi:signal transduction histidine kinase